MKHSFFYLSFILSIVLVGCGESGQVQEQAQEPEGLYQEPEGLYEAEYGKDYFYAENGMDERVKVKVGVARSDIVPNEALGGVAQSSIIRCNFRAKNQNSYIPREFSLFDNEGVATIIVKFLATNSYGAQGEESCYFKSDAEGKVSNLF